MLDRPDVSGPCHPERNRGLGTNLDTSTRATDEIDPDLSRDHRRLIAQHAGFVVAAAFREHARELVTLLRDPRQEPMLSRVGKPVPEPLLALSITERRVEQRDHSTDSTFVHVRKADAEYFGGKALEEYTSNPATLGLGAAQRVRLSQEQRCFRIHFEHEQASSRPSFASDARVTAPSSSRAYELARSAST